MTGGREITEKLIPAVARLAQVGDEFLSMIMMVIIMKIMVTQAQVRISNADDNDDNYVLPGWKFGGPNLCEDDAEAVDGASRL